MGKDLDLHPVVGFSANKVSFWKSLFPKNLSKTALFCYVTWLGVFFCAYLMVKSDWGNEVGQKRDLKGSKLQKEGKKRVSERNELCHRKAGPRLRKALRPERRAIHKDKW